MPMLQRFAVSESSDADSSSDSSASPTPVNKRRCVRPESSSSSSSRDEQSEPAGAKPAAGLMLNQLVAMNEGKTDVDQSVYAKQAVQPERIQQVLQETCCKKKCKRNLHWRLVLKMVTFFWVLPKVSQDCLLWSMQQNCLPCDEQDDESESGLDSSCQPRHKVAWSIEGREWIVPIEVIFRQFMFKSLYFNNTKGWVPHCQEFLCAAEVFWDSWVSVPRGWWGPGKRSKALTSGAWVPHLPSYDLFFWSTVISYWMPFVELVLFVFAHPHYYSYPSGG